MYMSFDEFCEAMGVEQGDPDAFVFWLRSHLMPPHLCQAVIEKRKAELAAE